MSVAPTKNGVTVTVQNSKYVGHAIVAFGACNHQWAFAPTAGYYECVRCRLRHNYDTPEYVRLHAFFTGYAEGER